MIFIMTRFALLFGLNYAHCKSGELRGCVNDVNLMKAYLRDGLGFDVTAFTDDLHQRDTSKHGMLKHLRACADKTWKDNLDVVWIHFSGHGTSIVDKKGDEEDGLDECLVPSDYETNGFIVDDDINDLFQKFNPKTHVICVFDCCHSGSMGDLKYSFDEHRTRKIENRTCKVEGRIITLSGCKDDQTSADACGVAALGEFSGALTACLLKVLKDHETHRNLFVIMSKVHQELKRLKFSQHPVLGASYDVRECPELIPSTKNHKEQLKKRSSTVVPVADVVDEAQVVPVVPSVVPVVVPVELAPFKDIGVQVFESPDDLQLWKSPKKEDACCFQ